MLCVCAYSVYQQIDNFDDNAFAWFSSFQKSRPGDSLFDKGLARSLSLLETFEKDLSEKSLPQVSWIIAPSWRSEHASHHPSVGEAFTARILKKLEKYPDVYAKSAFILNYDEVGAAGRKGVIGVMCRCVCEYHVIRWVEARKIKRILSSYYNNVSR